MSCQCEACKIRRGEAEVPMSDLGWFKCASDIEFEFVEHPVYADVPVLAAVCHPMQAVFGVVAIWREV